MRRDDPPGRPRRSYLDAPMTRQKFVRWTCDTCTICTQVEEHTQPEGWVGYGFTKPGNPDGARVDHGHLCPPCHALAIGAPEPVDAAEQHGHPGIDTWVTGSGIVTGADFNIGDVRLDATGAWCGRCNGSAHIGADGLLASCPNAPEPS